MRSALIWLLFLGLATHLLAACGGGEAEPAPTSTPTAKPVPVPTVATRPTAAPTLQATPAPTPDAIGVVVPTSPSFTWPHWSRTARIAGSAFHLEDTEEDIDAALDDLASQQVSVVLADSPWGWSYTAWMDDAEFYAVRDMMATVVKKAHARGLRVVMYQTGLELTSQPGPKPDVENSDWLQRSLDGEAVFFNDIGSEQEHWLDLGEWDLWLSPCSGYREFSQRRVRDMVETGIDGLWVDTVYLQHSIGSHEDLWPSADPCSISAFLGATGLTVPIVEDWEDPKWRRWIVWRHQQMVDYLLALKDAAHEVNPGLVFFEENWNSDSSGATQYANDPAAYLPYTDISTGHEVGTIGDRVDEGQTAMRNATLDQWLAYRTMVAFARAADGGKPSWILTYGYEPRDSEQMAGIVLAEAANFYETRGPGMAETVGEAYRTRLFDWIKANEGVIYGGDSAAEVGLLYSPRSRDLLDAGSGGMYDVEDSTHFAAYRAAANFLYRAHVPVDVVLDTDTSSFHRYSVLVLPEVQLMSDDVAEALRAFGGRLITVGDTGWHDQWMGEREENALEGVPQLYFDVPDPGLAASADTGLLSTDAPPEVQIGLRRTDEGYALVLVNTSASPTGPFFCDLRLADGLAVASARLSGPNSPDVEVAFSELEDGIVRVAVPAGVDTVALLVLQGQYRGRSDGVD